MTDSQSMALAEPVRKQGQIGGPLRSQLVPATAKGPRHPQGRSELAERSRPRSGLDGERGRGSLPGWEAAPRHPLGVVDGNGHRVVCLRVDQDTERENRRRWPTP